MHWDHLELEMKLNFWDKIARNSRYHPSIHTYTRGWSRDVHARMRGENGKFGGLSCSSNQLLICLLRGGNMLLGIGYVVIYCPSESWHYWLYCTGESITDISCPWTQLYRIEDLHRLKESTAASSHRRVKNRYRDNRADQDSKHRARRRREGNN
jgi:hypothetical protein